MGKIDFSKLKYSDKPISSADALRDVVPIELSRDVLDGKRQLKVTSASKETGSSSVRLEIS